MKDAAELIRAFADLLGAVLWPIVVLFVVLIVKDELPGLAARVKRLVLRSGDRSLEIELDELQRATQELEASADAVRRELPPATETPAAPEPGETAVRDPAAELEAALAAAVPTRLILVGLAAEIERATREVLASFADPSNWRSVPLQKMLSRLELPRSLQEAAREFNAVRNKIVHGRSADDRDVIRAIDLGFSILRAIQDLPREVHTVATPTVSLFRDAQGLEPLEGAHGVILQSTTPNGQSFTRIFPTQKEYVGGETVTWEWDTDKVWGRAWYHDPDTDEVRIAWDGAAEFAGRPVTDL
jgi:hypothetical protein